MKSLVGNLSWTCPLIDHLVHSRTLGSGEEFTDVFRKRYGEIEYEWGIVGGSTDFVGLASRFPVDANVDCFFSQGNVSYRMCALLPSLLC